VDGCRGVPLVVAGAHRCRHGCRQAPGHLIEHGTIGGGLYHELGGSGLFVPKPSCAMDCQRCGMRDLRTTVHQCPLLSTTDGGDCYSPRYSVACKPVS
jgi:hypothetical protein